jgi:hopene-associated glycosyltransferase HpnB
MVWLLSVAGGLAVAVWIYLLSARGMFWRAATVPAGSLDAPDAWSTVVAIIPARNEAGFIERSVASLLGEETTSRCGRLRLIVVDDASSDGTASLARAAAERAGASDRLTVLRSEALPPGWSGKLWALRQGIEAARARAPRWLLLTDADVVHASEDLHALLHLAESGACDMASLMVRLRCERPAERWLMPAFVFFFFKLYPPAWIAEKQRTTAGAAGGCILIRPEALQRSGGMEAIRSEVIDDCALAGAVKRNGGKVWLGLARQSASVRGYETLRSIGRMISRTAFNQLRHSAVQLGVAILGLAFVYLLPVALVFAGRPAPAVLGLLAWTLMAVAYFPMVRYYRLNPAWTITLPATALFYAGATLHSAFQYWRGEGGQWKGRVQDPLGLP